MQITPLTASEVIPFWHVFASILRSEFPGYSEKIIQYFLEKIYTPATLRYYVENAYKHILIARSDGEIVGFAVIDEPYGGVSLCRWLGIVPHHQRKGIGRELVKKWESIARSQHCHKIEVAAQPEAKEFYAKIGLELEGKRKKSYFGIDQYIFGKVLSEIDEANMLKR